MVKLTYAWTVKPPSSNALLNMEDKCHTLMPINLFIIQRNRDFLVPHDNLSTEFTTDLGDCHMDKTSCSIDEYEIVKLVHEGIMTIKMTLQRKRFPPWSTPIATVWSSLSLFDWGWMIKSGLNMLTWKGLYIVFIHFWNQYGWALTLLRFTTTLKNKSSLEKFSVSQGTGTHKFGLSVREYTRKYISSIIHNLLALISSQSLFCKRAPSVKYLPLICNSLHFQSTDPKIWIERPGRQ